MTAVDDFLAQFAPVTPRPLPNTIVPFTDQWGRHNYEDALPPCDLVPGAAPVTLIGMTSQISPLKNNFENYTAKVVAEFAVDNAAVWQQLDRAAAIDLIQYSKKRMLRKAANRGSSVHAVIDAVRSGDFSYLPDNGDAEPFMGAVKAFIEDARPRFLLGEVCVVNRTLGYAGSFDALGELDCAPHLGTILFDWKSRAKHTVYEDNTAQLSGYAHAEYYVLDGRRHRLPRIDSGAVVTFCDDGTYAIHPIDLEAAWPLTQVAIRTYQLKSSTKAIGRPFVAASVPTTDDGVLDALERSLAATTVGPGDAAVREAAALGGQATAAPSAAVPTVEGAPSPGPADPELAAWLHRRLEAVRDGLAGRALPVSWPTGVPTPKNGGPVTVAQCTAVEAWCDQVEKIAGLPFGPDRPRATTPAPADLVVPPSDPPVRTPADDHAALKARFQAVCANDLREAATLEARDLGVADVERLDGDRLAVLRDVIGRMEAAWQLRKAHVAGLVAGWVDPELQLLVDLAAPPEHDPHGGSSRHWALDELEADHIETLKVVVDLVGLPHEVITFSYDDTGDHLNVDPDKAVEILVVKFGGKQAALTAAREAAKATGAPGPRAVTDVAGNPGLLVSTLRRAGGTA